MPVGLVFSGQGSQRPGMGAAWRDTESWALVGELSEATGRDLAGLLLDCGAEDLARTDNAQLATFTLQMVILDALRRAGLPQDAVVAAAGHSLGEYSALAAAGIAPRGDAAGLVRARGEAMLGATAQRPGTMGVVLGLDPETVQRIAEGVRARGPEVWVANLNAPTQVVVSGTEDGVTAIEMECRALDVKTVRLPVGGAFHTPLMEPAAAAFAPTLAAWEPHEGRIPVVANLDARPYRGSRRWRELLAGQLLAPVRWDQSARCMVEELGCTVLVEVGAGSPLTSLAKRTGLPVAALSASGPAALPEIVRRALDPGDGGTGRRPAPRPAGEPVPAGTPAPEPAAAPVRLRGRPPYGYRLSVEGGGGTTTLVRRLTPDEATAPIVQRIFRQYLDGRGLQGIAEGLTADAIPCPSAHDQERNPHHGGVAWSKAAVRAILVNPRYTGQPTPTGQSGYPALAEPEQFAAVQETFEAKRRRLDAAATPARRPYLFRGLLRCAVCSRLMQGTWNNGEPYYRCRFPEEYAAANRIAHPRNVYLRERRLVRPLDGWLQATVPQALGEASRTGGDAAYGNLLASTARKLRALPDADPEERSRFYGWLRMRLTYSGTEPLVRVKLQLGPENLVIRGVVPL